MRLRYVLLSCLLLAASATAQPVPDTLRAPADADSITVYGWTVDADADRVLVGARVWPPPNAREAPPERADHHGTVFVYRRSAAGEWEVEGRLRADYISNEDCFSWSLDLRGDLAAVGAECEYGENPDGISRWGAVYLFRYDGSSWAREAKLYPSDVSSPWSGLHYFGESVSLGEDYLVVGEGSSPNPSNPDEDYSSGAAHIFERQEGTWTYNATLVNDDADDQVNERFGGAVGATGNTVLIGAPRDSAPEAGDRGAVYAFERSGGTWTQQQKLTAPPSAENEYFGDLIAVHEDEAVVSSWATSTLYPIEKAGDTWQVGTPLPISDEPVAVARYGDHILTVNREETGYLFTETEAGWNDRPFSTPPFDATRDELVSLTGQHAFVGIPDLDGGEVLVYDLPQLVDAESEAMVPSPLALDVAPNPTLRDATIRFELPTAGAARLTAYDALGREVVRLVDGLLPAGPQTVRLATHGLAPGTYLVRLEADGQAVTRLVTVVR